MRIATLLDPYFDKGTAAPIRAMDAEEWGEALGGFPAWAVAAACRWWKSAENENRRKRPMEGDIVARCYVEMQPVMAAQFVLSRPLEIEKEPEVKEVQSAEDRQRIAEEILGRYGFAAKKFGGEV